MGIHSTRTFTSSVSETQKDTCSSPRSGIFFPGPVSFSCIWGDALGELERVSPDVRIVNLETGFTSSDEYWKGKGFTCRPLTRGGC